MTFKKKSMIWFLGLIVPFAFIACDDDDDVSGTGELRIEVTDAPVDDEQISAVFVTISKVYVDGKLWEGFDTKYTIDLTALQNGNTQSLGLAEVDGKTYNDVSIVLDLEEDASGNSPGCYVLTQDQTKHDLATSGASEMTIDITSDNDFRVMNDQTTAVVIDFDLRKALRYGNPNAPSSNYAFGTQTEMNAALRFVSKNESGKIVGKVTDAVTTSDKIIVYAYEQGSFNRDEETDPPADEQFVNAVTSAEVDAQGNYTLAFLEEGEYELVFVSYEDDGNNGTMDLKGTLDLNAVLGLDLKSLDVGVASTVTVDVIVLGILPI